MAELLFITPTEMAATTILGGNVDPNNYNYCVADTQLKVIEPMLGSTLYDKIVSDIEGDTLTGDYKTLFDDYIKPMTKYEALATYIEIANYRVANGGIYKHTAENTELPSLKEVDSLRTKYNALAQMYVARFHKWISGKTIPEYTNVSCSRRDPNLIAGWKL